jgi:peptidoglycan/xylan/chitin deacetylase (PgdA/CDA1 family)
MARHLAHAVLVIALALEAATLPHVALRWAWPVTLLVFAGCIGILVTLPRVQLFVPTIFRGPTAAQHVAFTFDDGPDPIWTPRVLDMLAEHGAKGTFFVVGQRAEAHPELVTRMAREGHEVGCHTHTHAYGFHLWTATQIARDIAEAQAVLQKLVGKRAPMFRPPQGIRVPQLQNALNQLAERPTCVTWTARGFDSHPTTAARIEANLRPAVQAGSILTLHDGTGFGGGTDRGPTLEALGRLLDVATQRGLTCVSLSELLA